MIVADVNLVAYLLLGGPESALAERILDRDPVWAVPLFWRSEFRNILAAHLRQRGLALADAWRAHELAERLLSGNEFSVGGERVLHLVSVSECSAYDCEYVALAQGLQAPLVTWDRAVVRQFPKVAVSPKGFCKP
ncbi:MAG: type II toxin-antitoxin system VapC family toxin [Gemmatimonadales bacterium]|nr:type II toxin-antitoxin system VapC family toxin [Gemmatimonadales bacterium]